jgi:hypothetical protein
MKFAVVRRMGRGLRQVGFRLGTISCVLLLPAYHIEKDRKLIRSGDSFTVEGLGKDTAHELTEDNPSEHWAFVRRLWTREHDRWIATAQIIKPIEDNELRERLDPETKPK